MTLPPSLPSSESIPRGDRRGFVAIRVLSGDAEGVEVVVPEERPIVLGRSSEADVSLTGDDRISRIHARVRLDGGHAVIEDAGSTNGTVVNGRRVARARLSDGDRVELGSVVMVVVTRARQPSARPSPRALPVKADAVRETRRGFLMKGPLAEAPLSDLLQLLAAGRKTCVVHLHRGDAEGRVHMVEGAVRFAALDDWSVGALDALHELLSWSEGTFEVVAGGDELFVEEIDLPLETILLDHIYRIDSDTAVDAEAVDVVIPEEWDPARPEPPEARPRSRTTAVPEPARAPRRVRAEDLSLVRIPWRTEMRCQSPDLQTALRTAVALSGQTDADWVALRAVSPVTLGWIDEIVGAVSEILSVACDDEGPDGAAARAGLDACRRVVEGWLGAILPGEGGDRLWIEAWIAGLHHASEGIGSVHVLSFSDRLQAAFRRKCFASFAPEEALGASEAFDRITTTALALVCEARAEGFRESVARIGISEPLLRKMQGQVVAQLVARARGTERP